MTTTTTFQGMDPEAKSSSRVLRPPGGGSNISFGNEEEKPAARKTKWLPVFSQNLRIHTPIGGTTRRLDVVNYPDPVMSEELKPKLSEMRIKNRDEDDLQGGGEPLEPQRKQEEPAGGKPTGVLCGESSAPLRRCAQQPVNQTSDAQLEPLSSVVNGDDGKNSEMTEAFESVEEVEATQMEKSGASVSSDNPPGRRNPPGGKSSLILG